LLKIIKRKEAKGPGVKVPVSERGMIGSPRLVRAQNSRGLHEGGNCFLNRLIEIVYTGEVSGRE